MWREIRFHHNHGSASKTWYYYSAMFTKLLWIIIPILQTLPSDPYSPSHLNSGGPVSMPLSHSALVIHHEPDPRTKYTSKCWMGPLLKFPSGVKNSARHIFTPLINVQTPAEAIISCDSEEMLVPTEYNSADACNIDINTIFADYYVYLSQSNFTRFKAAAHLFIQWICCFLSRCYLTRF